MKRPQNMDSTQNLSWIMNYLVYEPQDWETDCWKVKKVNSVGRAQYYHNGKNKLIYRATWEFWNQREFPKNKVARHLCNESSCCNPLHICPGTAAENEKDKPVNNYKKSKLTKTPSNLSLEEKIQWWLENHTKRDSNGCLNFLGGKRHGYAQRNITQNGETKKFVLHRLVCAEKEKLDYEDKSWVARHICHNRSCINPEHIISGSRSENGRDSRNYSKATKLSEIQVREFLKEAEKVGGGALGWKSKLCKKYSQKFKVSEHALINILRNDRTTWEDIKKEYNIDHTHKLKETSKLKTLTADQWDLVKVQGFRTVEEIQEYFSSSHELKTSYIENKLKKIFSTYFTHEQVHEVCRAAEEADLSTVQSKKEFVLSIAEKYNQSQESIRNILHGKYHRNISSKYNFGKISKVTGGSATIHEEQVRKIIETFLLEGHTYKSGKAFDSYIAQKYSVSDSVIRRIRTKECWKSVWDEVSPK